MDLTGLKYLVVGAGFFGSVIAERVASICKEKVLIVEKRDHIGGNCFSYSDEKTGVECHKYGSHIFHTKEKRVRDYINRFTTFNSYQHQVLTRYKDTMYQMPINLATL
ncbi:MAG: NAD(P)-binding protein, partial [Nitrospinota bacterium]